MKVTPKRLQRKLRKYKVPVKYVSGWDSSRIDPYNGSSDFKGIVLHHTAGRNSLGWVTTGNPYAPVRACHFLVDHDGTVRVVSGVGAYHAGRGGPWRFTKKDVIPRDAGNRFLYGIEIESLGTKSAIDGSPEGMSVAQVTSTALLCVALLDAMRRGPWLYRVGRIIRHRDWAPGRKNDVRQDLTWWRTVVAIARRNRKDPKLARDMVKDFIADHPKGRL